MKGKQLSDKSVEDILGALSKQSSVGLVHVLVKKVSSHTAEMLLNHLHRVTVKGIMR